MFSRFIFASLILFSSFAYGRSASFDALRVDDGTAAKPSLRFRSDSNTGIYKKGVNQIAISLGGTDALDLTTTGVLINKDLLPSLTDTYDLGSGAARWIDIFGGHLDIDNTEIDGNTISTSSGNLLLVPTGVVQIQDGTQGTSGECFLSTDTSGSGNWDTCPTPSGFANDTLSNLGTTAINADLIFGSAVEGELKTQNNGAGDSEDLILSIGTATGTRGVLKIVDGSEGTSGECWVSTGVGGEGNWDTCPGGGGGGGESITFDDASPFTTTPVNLKSVDFDGVNERGVITYNAANHNQTNNISVSAWVKKTDDAAAFNTIFSHYQTSGNNRKWCALVVTGGFSVLISAYGTAGGAVSKRYDSSVDIADDEWHLVTFTFSSDVLKLYIDGVEDTGVNKLTDGTVNTLFSSTVNLLVGAISPSTPALFYTGKVSQLGYWDKQLSDADVAELFDLGFATPLSEHSAVANLVNHYKMGFGATHPTIPDEVNSDDIALTNTEAGDITADAPTGLGVKIFTADTTTDNSLSILLRAGSTTTGVQGDIVLQGNQLDLTDINVIGMSDLIEVTAGFVNYSITASTYGDLTSIVLTPGEWDISLLVFLFNNGVGTTGDFFIGLGTVAGNDQTGLVDGDTRTAHEGSIASNVNHTITIPRITKTVTTDTTFFFKALKEASIVNLQFAYKISARRIRKVSP